MKKELQNKEVQEYLKRFADDAAVSMIVADVKKRKRYVGKIGAITDMDQPVFVFAIDSEESFGEGEKIAQAKDETPEVIYEDGARHLNCERMTADIKKATQSCCMNTRTEQ